MENRHIILIVTVLIVFVINRLYVRADNQRKEAAKKKKVLSDKEIIALLDDPLTGQKAKVSATQNDYEYADDIPDDAVFYEQSRRTSEEVLNKYYTEDGDLEREFVLMKNYLLANDFVFKKITTNEIDFLESTRIFSSFDDWSYHHSYQKEHLNIFIADISLRTTHGKTSSTVINSSIVFWLKEFPFIGHYCLFKKPIIQNIIGIFIYEDVELLKGYHTEIVKKSAQEKALTTFLKQIQFDGELEIEVINSDILIRIVNLASFDNLMKLLNCMQNSD